MLENFFDVVTPIRPLNWDGAFTNHHRSIPCRGGLGELRQTSPSLTLRHLPRSHRWCSCLHSSRHENVRFRHPPSLNWSTGTSWHGQPRATGEGTKVHVIALHVDHWGTLDVTCVPHLQHSERVHVVAEGSLMQCTSLGNPRWVAVALIHKSS